MSYKFMSEEAIRDEMRRLINDLKACQDELVLRANGGSSTKEKLERECLDLCLKPGGFIEAIKHYRQQAGVGLREAKIEVERLREKAGIYTPPPT